MLTDLDLPYDWGRWSRNLPFDTNRRGRGNVLSSSSLYLGAALSYHSLSVFVVYR